MRTILCYLDTWGVIATRAGVFDSFLLPSRYGRVHRHVEERGEQGDVGREGHGFSGGLAVIVGVTVGLGSAAVAQAQKQPGQQGIFRLAATNTANAVSSLVGSVAQDAMLLIDNNGGGPALDLQVEPGQAPMKVDSGAKVANLNADRLDGKSEADFYAAGSQVSDSDSLDGKDSTEFLGANE